jgi:AraC-like DNA-binding protein
MPALLTRTSSLPYRSHASFTSLDRSSRCLTSVRAQAASPPASGLMHADIARRWKIEELASAVAMSRTTFTERFKALVGLPPLNYLIRCFRDRRKRRLSLRCRIQFSVQADNRTKPGALSIREREKFGAAIGSPVNGINALPAMVRVSTSLRDCHAAPFRISSPPHALSGRSAVVASAVVRDRRHSGRLLTTEGNY